MGLFSSIGAFFKKAITGVRKFVAPIAPIIGGLLGGPAGFAAGAALGKAVLPRPTARKRFGQPGQRRGLGPLRGRAGRIAAFQRQQEATQQQFTPPSARPFIPAFQGRGGGFQPFGGELDFRRPERQARGFCPGEVGLPPQFQRRVKPAFGGRGFRTQRRPGRFDGRGVGFAGRFQRRRRRPRRVRGSFGTLAFG